MSEAKERTIATLGENQYYVDSMSKEAQTALYDVTVIEGRMKGYEEEFNIARVAKDTMLARVTAEIDTFELVVKEAQPEEAK